MKIVYWAVKSRPSAGTYVIMFWTKPDRSNALEFKSVTTDEETIFTRISNITGSNRFDLVYTKLT